MSHITLLGSSSTPTYTPSLAFNDTGGAGGGDRNSMYLGLIGGLC